MKPSIGPAASVMYKYCALTHEESQLSSWMLTIVIENPIQLTIVSAVPFVSDAALCATKVENIGESAITTMPQKKRNAMNTIVLGVVMMGGEIKQDKTENERATIAVFGAPTLREIYPPIIHASPPIAMTAKDKMGTSRTASGWSCRYTPSITGTKAQNA